MALNYIFIAFFLVAFLIALLRVGLFFFNKFLPDQLPVILQDWGHAHVFKDIVIATFDMAKMSVMDILLPLAGIMVFWLGLMKIAEKAGTINVLSRFISPLFTKLFPELPKGHPAYGAMLMNISANMLGLDNAATPLGIKAMEELQKDNPDKKTATNAQIMFLVLNTSGLTLIPVSIMGLRASAKAANPADVFLPILLATFFSTLGGLIITSIVQKINLLNKHVIAFLGIISLCIAGIFVGFSYLRADQVDPASSLMSNLLLFSVIVTFIYLGWRKKVNVYSTFIEGAKEGFQMVVRIIPYLVGILVAIGVFRASGGLDLIVDSIREIVLAVGLPADWVEALPTGLMKPLSGSGARAMMVETMNAYGVDSFAAKLAGTFQGTTETTFYTLAVYFGAVGIKNTRNAVKLGLFADLIGIIAAIIIAYLFFEV